MHGMCRRALLILSTGYGTKESCDLVVFVVVFVSVSMVAVPGVFQALYAWKGYEERERDSVSSCPALRWSVMQRSISDSTQLL